MTALILDRTMSGPIEMVDDNTLVGKIVPWLEYAEVFDEMPNGTIDHYIEAFDRGAFDAQARSGNRGTIMKISMVDEHNGGLGKVGYAIALEDRDDGQYGTFRIVDRQQAIRQMVADGIDGLSMRFIPQTGAVRTGWANGIEQRIRTAAHMVHVALVAEPAYASARVMAMREAEEELRAGAAAARRLDEFDAEMARMDESRSRWDHLLPS